jgi:hypothetical protein
MYFKNSEVIILLKKSGWEEKRRINSEFISNLYKTYGYTPLIKVITFLQNFYGLTIFFKNKRNGLDDNFSFDLTRAFEIEVIERVKDNYEPRIGKELCIIGTAYREHFILLMDVEGNVYGAYDDYLVFIASSGYEAIEAILEDKIFKEIP